MARQIGVSASPEPKLVGSAKRNSPRPKPFQDPGHGTNGIHGLVRALHEPVKPVSGSPCSPARTRLPPFARMSRLLRRRRRWFSRRRRPQFLPLMRLSAHQCACRRLARLASPNWKSPDWAVRLELTRQLLGRASRSHQIDHLSPELRRISGSVAGHQTPQKSTSTVSTKPGQLQDEEPAYENARRTVKRSSLV